MSTAPRPQQHAVAHLSGERVDAPVAGVGGHHVEVAVQHERGLVRVPSRHACDDARAARLRLEELRREAEPAQPRLDVLRRLALAVRPALSVVRGVESDQVAGDHRGLVEPLPGLPGPRLGVVRGRRQGFG